MYYESLIAHDEPTAVVHPSETALDLPAIAVVQSQSNRSPAFRGLALSSLERGNGHLDPASP
jgi:hypothetical protein